MVLGVDDGPFNRRLDTKSLIIGTMMRLDFKIEAILTREIVVDGEDVTPVIASMVDSKHGQEIDLIVTNGVTFAGMNILDIDSLNEKTGVPVISVSRRIPDLVAMRLAIEKHSPQKLDQIASRLSHETFAVELNSNNKIYANCTGISAVDATLVLRRSCLNGKVPEAVRISHMIGSAIKFGESGGKA